MSPDGQRFLRRLRVSEVDRAREVLLPAVYAARGQQLLRAQHAEKLSFFIADEILSAVAAGHGQISGAQEPLVGQVGNQRRVLVIGMRGDVERAAEDSELLERELQLGRVALSGVNAERKEKKRDQAEKTTHRRARIAV